MAKTRLARTFFAFNAATRCSSSASSDANCFALSAAIFQNAILRSGVYWKAVPSDVTVSHTKKTDQKNEPDFFVRFFLHFRAALPARESHPASRRFPSLDSKPYVCTSNGGYASPMEYLRCE